MPKFHHKELKLLFDQIKNGNQQAFCELYKRFHKLVYGTAWSILKNKEDAEDVTQMVFTKLYEMDTSKFPANKQCSWLYTVTKNEAFTLLKKRNRTVELDTVYNTVGSDHEIKNTIGRLEFHQLMNRLNSREREIVSLKVLGGFSFAEIGRLLHEPTGTVKWRYYTALHSLKIALGNLALFVITLAGIVKVRLTKREVPMKQQEAVTPDEGTTQEDTKEKSYRDNSSIHQEAPNSNQQEETGTIVEESPFWYVSPNVSSGLLGLSAVFLALTILFFVFFAKHQPKQKEKMSK